MRNLHISAITKITLVIALFLGAHLSSFTQPAGFQGKRFIIGLEAPSGLTFSLNQDDYSYATEDFKNGYLNFEADSYSPVGYVIKPTLYLEYILNRKSSLQVYGRFFTRKVDVTSFQAVDPITNNYLVSYHPTERTKASFISGGLRYKWFKHEGLNPIGTYRTIAIEYNMMKYQFSDQNFVNYNENSDQYTYLNPEQSSTSEISVLYGMGVQRAISNSVLMNIGVELGFVAANIQPKSYQSDSKNYAFINGNSQIWKNTIFNVVFGFALAP